MIIAGQNDLSPGSLVAFSGVLCALFVSKGVPLLPAVLLTIVAGAIVGLFNTWMVNNIRIDAFIATLVTQTIVRGFAYIICGGKPVAISNANYITFGKARFLDIPLSVWIMLPPLLCSQDQVRRSIYDGGTRTLQGGWLDPRKAILICYVMMGIFCASAHHFLCTNELGNRQQTSTSSSNPSPQSFLGFLTGGWFFGGTSLIQAFNTGLTMVNVHSFWQYVARGALLLFALTSDYVRKQNREKMLLEASKRQG